VTAAAAGPAKAGPANAGPAEAGPANAGPAAASTAKAGTAGTNADGWRTAAWCVALGAANSTFILVVTGLLEGRLERVFTGGGVGPGAFAVLTLLRVTFLVIALVVSTVVTTNAYGIVAAGQARLIALRRLLGAPAAAERRRLVRQAMRQAVPLSLLAAAVSGLACLPMVNALLARGHTPGASLGDLAGTLPAVAAGLLVHLACVRWAVTRGYAPVLAGGPVVALRVAEDPGHLAAGGDAGTGEDGRGRASRWVRVCVGIAAGTGALALAAAVVTPYAVLPGLVAAGFAAAALLGSADRVVSGLVRGLTRFARPGGDLDIAGRRIRQNSLRSSRAALAVAAGVCVVTMLAVASATALSAAEGYFAAAAGLVSQIDGIVLAASVMISMTALTSALGVITTISHGLRLRHREIALLRVVGQTPRQTRRMIRAEAGLLSGGGVLLGLALGVAYGWFGAQLLLSKASHRPVLLPVIPVPVLLAAAVAAAALTWLASAWPARQALRRTPIRAYLDA
jgi:putative ABC transport system permease protein